MIGEGGGLGQDYQMRCQRRGGVSEASDEYEKLFLTQKDKPCLMLMLIRLENANLAPADIDMYRIGCQSTTSLTKNVRADQKGA